MPLPKKRQEKIPLSLLWINLFSLDAPVVAVSWQWLLSFILELELSYAQYLVLFNTVWIIYTIDRYLDARSIKKERLRLPRHQFHARYSRLLVFFLGTVLFITTAVAFYFLDKNILYQGTLLSFLVLGYMLIAHHFLKGMENSLALFLLSKEVLVGILFSSGTFLVISTRAPFSQWGIAALFFAVLCFLNCAWISLWEKECDEHQEQRSLATCYENLEEVLIWGTMGFLGIALGGSFLSESSWKWFYGCAFVSAGGLLALYFLKDRVGLFTKRVGADLVLWIPLLLWSFQ